MNAVPSTVAELLLRHAEEGATGVLTLNRGQVRKQLFLRDGALVSAESNLREEALGELLVLLGLLPQSRLEPLLGEVKRRGRKMGSVVIELGWVTPEEVFGALREQVRRRTSSCLRWAAADAGFEAGRGFVGSIIEHRFEVGPLVFGGLRDNASLELLEAPLEGGATPRVSLEARFERFRADFETVFGGELPALLAPGCELGNLVLRPDAGSLVFALEALLATGLARLDESAPATGAVERPLGMADSAGRVAHPAASTIDSGALRMAEQWKAENSARGITAPPSLEDVRLPGAEGDAAPGLSDELMREVLSVHERGPYDVLGVQVFAGPEDIDAAYAAKLARLKNLPLAPAQQPALRELEAAYTRAHALLRNPTVPDAPRPPELDRQSRTPAPVVHKMDPIGAEQAFREGRHLLDANQPQRALGPFRRAVDLRPDQATYHAWLGWTLYHVHGHGAMPEALDRLEHAIAVDPDSSEGHGLLGGLLTALGESARARAHLERALYLRPEQGETIELLARLYIEAGEPQQAERLYRRLLATLGDREPALRRVMWRQLGELCEGPLGNREAAARAFAVAARLDPSDAVLQRKAADLLGL